MKPVAKKHGKRARGGKGKEKEAVGEQGSGADELGEGSNAEGIAAPRSSKKQRATVTGDKAKATAEPGNKGKRGKKT